MRYYAHFGHTDFVLCLGYGASAVKDYFLQLRRDARRTTSCSRAAAATSTLFSTDITDWRITFIDTGLNSPIGERLRRVRHFVQDEEMFLANYADVLTDAPLPDRSSGSRRPTRSPACSLAAAAVDAPRRRHPRRRRRDHRDQGRERARPLGERRILRAAARHLRRARTRARTWSRTRSAGSCRDGRLIAFAHKGFWTAADTVKDRILLEEPITAPSARGCCGTRTVPAH